MSDAPAQAPEIPRDDPAPLVREAVRGSERAREALVRRYLRPAYCVALSIVSRPADAEDIAQDALIKALVKIESCRSAAAFEPWLMQIVRNHARSWRARRTLRDVSSVEARERAEGAEGPRATDRLAMQRQLLDALEQLTETQRAVVLLHDLEGYTHPEVAELLELSVVNSRQHLYLARRQLRAHLAKGNEP